MRERTVDESMAETWIATRGVVLAACLAALAACGSPATAAPAAPTTPTTRGAPEPVPDHGAKAVRDAQGADASLDVALGKLREEQFQVSVAAAREKSQACYSELLQKRPEIEVRVVLRLRFDITGKISDMKFDSPPADPSFAKCIEAAWYGVSLPVEKDGDLVVPLHFIPEAPGE